MEPPMQGSIKYTDEYLMVCSVIRARLVSQNAQHIERIATTFGFTIYAPLVFRPLLLRYL